MRNQVKYIYNHLPFKAHFFKLIKSFWIPSPKIYKHLHFFGIIKVKVNNKSSFKIHHVGQQIENELFWAGLDNAWEKVSMSLWTKLSKNSSTIFDIGAYSGLYALVSASLNSTSKIHAFEPMRHNFDLMDKNIRLNNYSNISAIPKACSNFSGEAIVYTRENTTLTTSVTVNKSLYEKGTILESIPIHTIKIEDYFNQLELNELDLIKIDVETHEPEVLEGMGGLIKKYRPTFLIEILNDEVAKKIESYIEGLGYLYFDIDELTGIKQVESLKQSSYYNYLICQKSIAKELDLI